MSAGDGPIAAYRRLRRDGELNPDPAQELAAEKLEALHHRLKAYDAARDATWRKVFALPGRRIPPPPQGLYIFGGVGRGKSMLMDLLFRTSSVAAKRRDHFHAFMQDVHAAIHAWRQKDASERDGDDPIPPLAASIAADARLLCFDEFQVTDVADAMILGRLFGELFENGVVVVATSNRAPDELYEGGLNRELFLPFIDLLSERLDVLHLPGGTDHRLARRLAVLGGLTTYQTPLGAAATAALDQAFTELTDGAQPGPETLTVQGREVVIPQAAKGVARAGFDAICGAALGAADYLALANRFHTLVLDAVPRLGPEKRNEAKRLVTLIDVLYEHKVKLVVSADAVPEALYPAGDGSFEFTRTASRLQEMQSADYLAQAHLNDGG